MAVGSFLLKGLGAKGIGDAAIGQDFRASIVCCLLTFLAMTIFSKKSLARNLANILSQSETSESTMVGQ